MPRQIGLRGHRDLGRSRRVGEAGVVAGVGPRGVRELEEPAHDQPHHHPAREKIGRQRADPKTDGHPQARLPGHDGDDGMKKSWVNSSLLANVSVTKPMQDATAPSYVEWVTRSTAKRPSTHCDVDTTDRPRGEQRHHSPRQPPPARVDAQEKALLHLQLGDPRMRLGVRADARAFVDVVQHAYVAHSKTMSRTICPHAGRAPRGLRKGSCAPRSGGPAP
ncbi:MAG TPA: hypothetical protein VMD28_04370 [Acidimicrobiales bacterium]|nr:hypothetical protein [Acidimicrobiales bacterium]